MGDFNDNTSYENIHPESKTILECTGFSQINNNVINNIKDGDAFLVWCYLYSKTTNWKTIKQNIKNKYGFGDAKLKKIFSYLRRCRLIEYVQNTDEKGQFGNVKICILNGSKFDKTQSYIESKPVGQKSTPPVKRTNGNDELRNKDITKERKIHNKPPIPPKGECERFDEFWEMYPVKAAKKSCASKWRKAGLDSIAETILDKLHLQIRNDDAWARGYAPNPLTYLTQERWNDDIKKPTSCKSSSSSFSDWVNGVNHNEGRDYDQHGNVVESLDF